MEQVAIFMITAWKNNSTFSFIVIILFGQTRCAPFPRCCTGPRACQGAPGSSMRWKVQLRSVSGLKCQQFRKLTEAGSVGGQEDALWKLLPGC